MRLFRYAAAFAIILTGCSTLIGVNDLYLDPAASGDGGLPDGTVAGDSGADSPSSDASVCGDLTMSKQNCGRCGHDCLGGDCNAGQCQPTTLLNAQGAPRDLAFDDTYVYVANYGDGTIQRIAKDGSMTGAATPVSAWSSLSGVAVDNGKLFWVAYDAVGTGLIPDGGDNNDSYGGLWSCTLPACTDKKLIDKPNNANKIVAAGGYIYITGEDDVRRVKEDGTGEEILNNVVSQSFGIAVDSANVYFDSIATTIMRCPLDGGPSTDIGPVGDTTGLLALDDQRVFWTFYSSQASGLKGSVYSTTKANPGDRISYGDKNIASTAVASDGANVYWLNDSTYDQFTPNPDGELRTCPVAGCVGDPTLLLGGMLGASQIKIDGNAVYFLEYGGVQGKAGRLLKIAKQ